jgi:hypothetical protein
MYAVRSDEQIARIQFAVDDLALDLLDDVGGNIFPVDISPVVADAGIIDLDLMATHCFVFRRHDFPSLSFRVKLIRRFPVADGVRQIAIPRREFLVAAGIDPLTGYLDHTVVTVVPSAIEPVILIVDSVADDHNLTAIIG